MQYTPTPEQSQLKDSARRYIDKSYVDKARKAALASGLGYAAENWATFAEQGWLMASLPEEAGGLGGTPYDSAVIAEELGRGLVVEPFVPVAIIAGQMLAGLAPHREDLLTGLMGGELRVVPAHGEAATRAKVSFVQTTAKAKGGGFVLNGVKTAVLGGPVADVFLVSARTSGADGDGTGITLFVVPADAAGLTRQDYKTLDDRGASNLTLTNVEVKADAVLGTVDEALPAIARAVDYGLVISSAEALGAMLAALDVTRSYLMTRKQYGQLIGNYQALRHKVADMFIESEQARSMVLKGLDALNDSDPKQRARWASACKTKVAQSGKLVTGQAIQLHGGIGVTEEYIVGHYFKRITVFNLFMGTSHDHLERFSRLTGLEK
jgi:alkylation response protein AidB-like acyl-CoA dehydrogenase